MRKLWSLSIAFCLCLAAASVFGQDVQTKGCIGGTITDQAGAAIPGAKVTVTGPQVERTVTANESGIFRIENLDPGTSSVRVEKTGFRAAVANRSEEHTSELQ